MGACYSVDMKIRLKDKGAANRVLRKHIYEDTGTDYNLKAFAREGITPDDFDNLMRIFLAGWKKTPFEKTEKDGWIIYSNDFDASYGWNTVMFTMFELIKPYLEDDSQIIIGQDNYTYTVTVENNGDKK